MEEKRKKVEAKNVEELYQDDVENFVYEILQEDGFPLGGWKRYVYFKNGYLYATKEIHENSYLIFDPDEIVVFEIESWEKYAFNVLVKIDKKNLSWEAPISEWIKAYMKDAFAYYRLRKHDYI